VLVDVGLLVELTRAANPVGDDTAEQDQSGLHEILTRFQHSVLRVVDVQFLLSLVLALYAIHL
jgi:hypothetical protein